MRNLARIWILAAIPFLCCAAFAQAQKPQNDAQPKPVGIAPIAMKLVGDYGGWWNTTPQSDRYTYLGAYLDAMREVHDMAHGMGMERAKEAVPGAATFNCKMEQAVSFSVMAEEFDFEVKVMFVPELNAFYADPLNARIPFGFAIRYVRDEAKGKKTAGQLLDELNSWRQAMGKN